MSEMLVKQSYCSYTFHLSLMPSPFGEKALRTFTHTGIMVTVTDAVALQPLLFVAVSVYVVVRVGVTVGFGAFVELMDGSFG